MRKVRVVSAHRFTLGTYYTKGSESLKIYCCVCADRYNATLEEIEGKNLSAMTGRLRIVPQAAEGWESVAPPIPEPRPSPIAEKE